jgi:transcriptional regulator with XRE-family HTH domain
LTGSDEGVQSGWTSAPMSPAQSRAARGLLGWSEADLAAKVGLGEAFVRDFEAGRGDPASGQIEALRSALIAAGAVFSNGDSPGVRLERRSAPDEGTRADDLTTENDR